MKRQTIALQARSAKADVYGALHVPIYQNASYEFESAEAIADVFTERVLLPDYSRVMNPTVTYFEDKIAQITGASRVIALNSGMAAISSSLLMLARAGQNIVASRHMFGNTYSLMESTLRRYDIETRFVDLSDMKAISDALDERTACLFLEIMTNPQLEVPDIRAIADASHSRGVAVVVDSTMIPFTEFSSRALGADVEVVSTTKYLSCGATSIGGVVIDYGTVEGFGYRMTHDVLFNLGMYMTPQVAYMHNIGLETLSARYGVQSSNALYIAEHLEGAEGVRGVNYVGLRSNPYHELSRRQYGETAGAMLTIDLESEAACYATLNRLKLFRRATNLFDSKSLAIHPYSTIYGNFSREERAAMDVLPTTIRLSIGLEDAEDLVEDILAAIRG